MQLRWLVVTSSSFNEVIGTLLPGMPGYKKEPILQQRIDNGDLWDKVPTCTITDNQAPEWDYPFDGKY